MEPSILSNIPLMAALLLTAAGIFILLPKRLALPRPLGWVLVLAGLVAFAVTLIPDRAPITNDVLFALFSGSSVLCGVLMITSRNPVYGALWFALVTLSVCGLFMLQSAPFLAAATVVVYAGAIIVTFLFVVMLAQQSGRSIYDQRSHHPLLATVGAFVLLGTLLATIDRAKLPAPVERGAVAVDVTAADAAAVDPTADALIVNPFSQPTDEHQLGSLHALGRSLFGDYLFAVEIAGTLLLIASVGAILVSPRKEQVTV